MTHLTHGARLLAMTSPTTLPKLTRDRGQGHEAVLAEFDRAIAREAS